jgi:hypothetical protein
MNSLAQGKPVEDDILYQGADEIAQIVTSARQLRDNIKGTIAQAKAIAAGNYAQEVRLMSSKTNWDKRYQK